MHTGASRIRPLCDIMDAFDMIEDNAADVADVVDRWGGRRIR